MTIQACVLCHYKDLRPRWIGDVMATFCDACGCLYFPDLPPPTPRAVPGERSPMREYRVQRERPAAAKGT